MANKLYEEGAILNIARAIREKNGSAETYTVSEMPAAIQALTVGGGGLSIDGFALAGGKFTISGNNLSQTVRTITHNLTNNGTPIVPLAIFIYDPNTFYTLSGTNGYTKSIMYDMTTKKYYKRNVINSQQQIELIDCSSDTTGVKVGPTTFELPNAMYYAMHNFCWIAIGGATSGTTEVTCTGGYVS